ncbi:MAG: hypothetical protein SPK83_04880 [Succinivibrio dextrinosolvens]|nr:hypothetical protein [Succinivibrio dextrinosolvens]
MAFDTLDKLKFILREDDMPMFTDQQLQNYLQESESFELALYELLLLKSENTSLELQGMTIEDTSSYFRRLASTYRPHNSGLLGG